ncbi:MAG: site-2 protease family protein [Coriobacteriia bacterium]|nr:site-2 protease family protein [Coriobacteriia bacterium]
MGFPTINIEYLISIAISILCFVPALVLHEVAHGFAAYKLGDPTAKRAGRLSLNPLKHIDIFGTVILPLLLMLMKWPVIGYAKPVPYNPSYFKDPRRGDLIVGLAGPSANLIMALIAAAIAWLTTSLNNYYLMLFLFNFAAINLFLMFFNLLPIPPLDGSSIFAILIPRKYLPKYYKIQHYAMPIFMILILIVPYVLNFNPIGLYLNLTAGNLLNLIFP